MRHFWTVTVNQPLTVRASRPVHRMQINLEAFAPAADGRSAARIEEEVFVTEDGPKVITLFPCEELMIANKY